MVRIFLAYSLVLLGVLNLAQAQNQGPVLNAKGKIVDRKEAVIHSNVFATALINATSQRKVAVLIPFLEGGDIPDEWIHRLILAVGQIGDPAGVPSLVSLLKRPELQNSCFFALGECGYAGVPVNEQKTEGQDSAEERSVLQVILSIDVEKNARITWFEAFSKLADYHDDESRDRVWEKWRDFSLEVKSETLRSAWRINDVRYRDWALAEIEKATPVSGSVYYMQRSKLPISFANVARLVKTYHDQPETLLVLLKSKMGEDTESELQTPKESLNSVYLRTVLLGLFNHPDWRVRVEAARALKNSSLSKKEDLFLFFDDPNPNVKKALLESYLPDYYPDPELQRMLIRNWKELSSGLKWVTIQNVPEVDTRWMSLELSSWLKSKTGWLHRKGISGLRKMKGLGSRDLLESYYDKGASVERVLALEAGMGPSPENSLEKVASQNRDWLMDALFSEDPFLFAFAIDHMSDSKMDLKPEVIEKLTEKLFSEGDVQYFSLKPMAETLGQDVAKVLLEKLLDSKYYAVRMKAAEALNLANSSPVFVTPWNHGLSDELLERAKTNMVAEETLYWVLTTEKGNINIELFLKDAPITCASIVGLTRDKYFRGMAIHRVVPNFVVQAGDSRGDGSGGPGYVIPCEINRNRYKRGSVGMALAGKDTGGSQFFICHTSQPHLDGGYTVFGRVVSGMPIVDILEESDLILKASIKKDL